MVTPQFWESISNTKPYSESGNAPIRRPVLLLSPITVYEIILVWRVCIDPVHIVKQIPIFDQFIIRIIKNGGCLIFVNRRPFKLCYPDIIRGKENTQK